MLIIKEKIHIISNKCSFEYSIGNTMSAVNFNVSSIS